MMVAWLLHSMMWPYIMLFSSQRLNQPLTSVAWLMTVNSVFGLVATFLGGAIADRFGRKWVMVFSLFLGGIGWYFFRSAGALPIFALLLGLIGAATPLYRLASDSMVADLIPEENRLNAYSLLRMGNNFGVALGPAIGGLLVAKSYNLCFSIIGVGFILIGVYSALIIVETKTPAQPIEVRKEGETGGYIQIFKDKTFMMMLGGLSLNRIATSILWLMLAVYSKQNFGLPENVYGLIPATNAIMVVLFQLLVTRQVNRRNPQAAMVLGALIYAGAIFSVSFGTGFWGFWVCMVMATVGEMILVPTATTFTSRLAPQEMRARYMSIYNVAYWIGTGVGPVLAGFAEKLFEPRAMWYAAGLVGFLGALVLLGVLRVKMKNSNSAHNLRIVGRGG